MRPTVRANFGWRNSVLLLALMPFIPALAQENRRTANRVDDPMFQAIGVVVDREKGRRTTGTLVSRCHVLTAAHIFDDVNTSAPRAGKAGTLSFSIGPPENGRPFQRTITARPVDWGNHAEFAWHEDWLLLKLDECAGDTFRPIPIEPLSLQSVRGKRGRIIVAGFPGGDVASISYNAGCSVAPMSDELAALLKSIGYKADWLGNEHVWLNNCIQMPGISGAGLFYVNDDPALRLFGLQLGQELQEADPNFPDHRGISISVSPFYRRLQRTLDGDRIIDGRNRSIKLINNEKVKVVAVGGKAPKESTLGGFPMGSSPLLPGRSTIVNFENFSGNCNYHVHVTLEGRVDRHLGDVDVCAVSEIMVNPEAE